MIRVSKLLLIPAILAVFASCSTTSGIPDDDRLFIGLTPIKYDVQTKSEHYASVIEEMEAALATAPNGALFGSSRFRSPFPVGLWIWNAFHNDSTGVGRWLVNSFGTRPILMSWVNPQLRASVAKEVLRTHGYMRGQVDYEIRPDKNPKKARIAYKVTMGHLFTVDTLTYHNFPHEADSLIHASKQDALIGSGSAFDISTLDGERNRLATLLRNNGYYFYQPGYAKYLADTLTVPGKVQLRLQMADRLPETVQHKWYVGDIHLYLRERFREPLQDSVKRRSMTVHFNGRRPPVRNRVIRNVMLLRKGDLYRYDDYQASADRLAATGLFSTIDFKFTPRDTTHYCDTIDLNLDCVFDKPYDFYISSNLTGKTNNYFGPGIEVGLTKRNAFRGGETLNLNARGSYEWQIGGGAGTGSNRLNSYEYGFDASLEYPRIVLPWNSRKLRRRRFYSPPSTVLKVSSDVINRAKYFKRHIVSGEWTYNIQPTARVRHQFSPLIFSYEYMVKSTHTFDSIMTANPYLLYTMQDQFIPKMQYTFTYTDPVSKNNPLWFKVTASEAGNLVSLGYMVTGKKWGTKGKEMMKNPYAQFFKLEAELVKSWRVSEHSTLVGHINAGAIWSYGNSTEAPYSEQFYVGGANSIRAFSVRSIGPGSYHDASSADMYYLDQTGNLKILANLEYRPRLFGNLYGALFLDAGNVWTMKKSDRDGSQFKPQNILKETALGTGIGLRYDLDFLVIRIDWGVGLHVPYKPGFYNVGKFSDSHSLHFAVGYPF